MNICVRVGQTIRKLRHRRKLSQEALASKAGIDRSYLSEIESGYKSAGLVVLDQIASALGVKIIALFAEER